MQEIKKEAKKLSPELDTREKMIAEKMVKSIEEGNKDLPEGMSLVLRGNQVFFKRQIKVHNFAELKWAGLNIFPFGNMVVELIPACEYKELEMDPEMSFEITDNITIKNTCDIKEFPLEIEVYLEDELDYEMLTYSSDSFPVGNTTLVWMKSQKHR